MNAILWVYLVGVTIGLWRTDGPWPTRLLLALLWPIGPIAFVVTVAILLASVPVAFVGPRAR